MIAPSGDWTVPANALAPLGLAALAALTLVALTQTQWSPLLHHAGHHAGPAPALTAFAWMIGWSLMAVALMLPAATPLIARTTRGRGLLAAGFLGRIVMGVILVDVDGGSEWEATYRIRRSGKGLGVVHR